MSINLENVARNILMPSNPTAQTVPGPYKRDQIQSIPPKMQALAQADEIRALVAENAKLKQENARRRMKMQDMEQEIDSLKAAMQDIMRTPEGDEQSAQAIAREVLGMRGI